MRAAGVGALALARGEGLAATRAALTRVTRADTVAAPRRPG